MDRLVGRAAEHAARTECVRGHPFDDENTIMRTRGDGRKYRACRTCERAHSRKADAKLGKSPQKAHDRLNTLPLPSAPLVDAIARFGKRAVLRGASEERVYQRARSTGRISMAYADEWAVRMGLHPAELFGEDWWQDR